MSSINGYTDPFEVKDKDPDYIYRWCNSDERAMLRHQADGFEPVMDTAPELKTATPPTTADAGGVTRRRGTDLVLCKVRRESFDRTVGARRRAAVAAQDGSIDSSIGQINDQVESAMKRRGQSVKGLVFRSSDDEQFGKELQKKG